MKPLSHPALGRAAGLFADTINDAASTRKVYLLAAGLAILGILLIIVTVWFWRTTRHDPELLAPLEVMSKRRFREVDDGTKQQLLDSARPPDAQPMRWGFDRGTLSGRPEVDLGAIRKAQVVSYEDLREPVDAVAVVPAALVAADEAVANEVEEVEEVEATIDTVVTDTVVADAGDEAAVEPADGDAEVLPVDSGVVPAQDDAPVAAVPLPFVIKPLDHGLPQTGGARADEPETAPVGAGIDGESPRFDGADDHDDDDHDDDDHYDDDDHDADTVKVHRAAIDPLLRRLERSD